MAVTLQHASCLEHIDSLWRVTDHVHSIAIWALPNLCLSMLPWKKIAGSGQIDWLHKGLDNLINITLGGRLVPQDIASEQGMFCEPQMA